MTITAGTKLGPYDVIEPLGAGGMGVVFRARDTRLNRLVAIKVLPAPFAEDGERVARFEREAQALAALNHPHIAQIHGIEDGAVSGGGRVRALVMELVEGEDLSQRLARGPVPLEEALPIGRQIADALEAAHDQGIVHRDLKPANIMVRADGTVKVLDFGLAKALAGPESGLAYGLSPAQSPTVTTPATLAGTILGTAAYMAPEQAKGKPVDRRADIWAFGVVLYELLTGRLLFAAETVAETIGLIVTREPDLSALPKATPHRVRELLRRCLERDPRQRLRDAGEARIALTPPYDSQQSAGPSARRPWRWPVAAVIVAALAIGAAVGVLLLAPDAAVAPPAFAFDVAVPGAQIEAGAIAVSPDGTHIAFRVRGKDGSSEIWVRPFGQSEARRLPGTRDTVSSRPFWSPDGRHLGFFVGQDIWRIPIDGSAARRIASAPLAPRGGSWGRDDVVLFGTEGGPIYAADAGGGSPPRAITKVEMPAEEMHIWPAFLPDGRQFVFLTDASTDDGHRIRLAAVGGGDSKVLLRGIRSSPTVDPRGALLLVERHQLVAYAFDFAAGTLARQSHLVADGVGALGDRHDVPASVGGHDVLAYQKAAAGADLVRMSLDTGAMTAVASGERFANPVVAPNGRAVALDITAAEGSGRAVWLHDLERGVRSLISERGVNAEYVVWSADGDTAYFAANKEGGWKVYRKSITGTATPEMLGAPPDNAGSVVPVDASRDGKYLLVSGLSRSTNWDLFLLPLDRTNAEWITLIATPAVEVDARFSRDSRWIVYSSTATGQPEIFVSAVDSPAHRVQISSAGGTDPLWTPDSRQILYRSPTDRLMSVDVTLAGGTVRAGAPRERFELQAVGISSPRNVFEIMPNGKEILVVRRLADEDTAIQIRTGPLQAR